jgi:hypothetical protein
LVDDLLTARAVCGQRLFGEMEDKLPLRLVDSKVVGEGIAILTYSPA